MPRLSDVFHGKTLSASDLDEEGQVFTITDVDVKQFDDGPKLMISLEETDKAFVANKTNSQTIAQLYGDDTDEWAGARISLYQTWVDFQGKQVQAIRVKPKKPAAPRRAKPHEKPAPPVTQDEAEMDADEWEAYGRR